MNDANQGQANTPKNGLVELNVPGVISRRAAMQWVLAAVAASQLPSRAFAGRAGGGPLVLQSPTPGGYGTDLDLTRSYKPGDLWPLTFNDAQRKAATALADVILPKDHLGPAASEVGVPAMIDEWISAPYPDQQADRPVIVDGLNWLDTESQSRFGKIFGDASLEQQTSLCQEICYVPKAPEKLKAAAQFFSLFRTRCAGAYYATKPGWDAIGYVGNTPLPQFDGPPPEVLKILGVEQTVA